METPLDAREFIRRFHLPQLVRISQPPNEEQPPETTSNLTTSSTNNHLAKQQVNSAAFQRQDNGGWTYAPGGRPVDGPSSLLLDSRQQIIRMPRVSLAGPAGNSTADLSKPAKQQRAGRWLQQVSNAAGRESSCPTKGQLQIKLTPPSNRPALNKLHLDQPFLLYKAYRKLELCAYAIDVNNELNDKSGDPIYFPHNYPGWFSISPTTISTTNTTGPRNHTAEHKQTPGGRRARTGSARQTHYYETIDQVCRSNGQVFLTRDELIGFKLPSKLSHLTKLKNNQLLAVPLAINLNPKQTTNEWTSLGSSAGDNVPGSFGHNQPVKSSSKSSNSSSINDICQVVVEAGQVLQICGVYEDVLPLIEGAPTAGGQASRPSAKKQDLRRFTSTMINTAMHNQMAPQQNAYPDGGVLLAHEDQQPLNQQQLIMYSQQNGNINRRTQKLLELRYAHNNNNNNSNQIYHQQDSGNYNLIAPPLIYAPQMDQQRPQYEQEMSKKKSGKLKANKGSSNQQMNANWSPQGQRYARCVLLNEYSIDKLTGGINRRQLNELNETHRLKSEGSEAVEELEVLIPIDQRGRFYLCATSQTIANELYNNCHNYCAQSQPQYHPHQMQYQHQQQHSNYHHNSQNLVFRMSQIVYLLNLNKRLALNNNNQRRATSATANNDQCPRPLVCSVDLPLQVRLIVGPRPANFSPSMFGSPSSTLESYFSLESNVAGHSIRCRFNRMNNHHGEATQQRSPNNPNGPVCLCPQQLFASDNKLASTNNDKLERSLLFSATLRIESISKRDVLLACTIKQDPLEHLDQQTQISRAIMDFTGGGPGNVVKNKQLELLRQQAGDYRTSSDSISGSKSIGKSSMSRLRACRSLISRKKQRPNIPNSMLINNNGLPLVNSPLSERPRAHYDLGDIVNSQQHCGSINTYCQPIVLVEFDCNDEGLKFARTFIEPSIPTASIPDLVLNRMEFCQLNSYNWERHLKLSNETLSQDYDAFQRQLGLASTCPKLPNNDHFHSIQSTRLKGFDNSTSSSTAHRYAEDLSVEASPSVANPADQMDSNNNTASSRSSSGVSSSGDRRRQLQPVRQSRSTLDISSGRSNRIGREPVESSPSNNSTGTNEAIGSSMMSSSGSSRLSSDRSPSSSVMNSSSQPTNPANSSRLLRFVRKVLPANKPTCRAPTSQQAVVSSNSRQQQQQQTKRLMEELTGRLKGANMDTSSSQSSPGIELAPTGDKMATLMNSQKIHRRLMTGSVRHLPASFDQDEEDDQANESKSMKHIDPDDAHKQTHSSEKCPSNDSGGGQLVDDDDQVNLDDSSSHLYESLERLNEGLNKLNRAKRTTTTTNDQSSEFEGSAGLPRSAHRAAEKHQGRPSFPDHNSHHHHHHEHHLRPKQSRFLDASKRRVGIGKSMDALARLSNENQRHDGEDENDVDFDVDQYVYDYNAEWWRQGNSCRRGDGMRLCRRPKRWDINNRNNWKNSLASLAPTTEQPTSMGSQQHRGRYYQVDDMDDMEPVSIEACDHDDEFTSIVAANEMAMDNEERRQQVATANDNEFQLSAELSASSSLSTSSSSILEAAKVAEASSRSLGNLSAVSTGWRADVRDKLTRTSSSERIYMNIGAHKSSSGHNDIDHNDNCESQRKRLVTRMERKLAKLRGRHHLTARQFASMNQDRDEIDDEVDFNQSKSLNGMRQFDGADNSCTQMRSLGWEPADEVIRDSQLLVRPSQAFSASQSRLNKLQQRCQQSGPRSLNLTDAHLIADHDQDQYETSQPSDGADMDDAIIHVEPAMSASPTSPSKPINCDNLKTTNDNSLMFRSLSSGSSLGTSESSFSSSSFATSARQDDKDQNDHLSDSPCSSTLSASVQLKAERPCKQSLPAGTQVTKGNLAELNLLEAKSDQSATAAAASDERQPSVAGEDEQSSGRAQAANTNEEHSQVAL